jgi:hypothetical protein
MTEDTRYLCNTCFGGYVPHKRFKLGYSTCLPCGEQQAQKRKHTIVPSHKSNYIVVTDMDDLKDLNPKYIRSAK